MEQKPLTTQQVIDLITPIPDELWLIGQFQSSELPEAHCVMGHVNISQGFDAYGMQNGITGSFCIESEQNKPLGGLRYRALKFFQYVHNETFLTITQVNDGSCPQYYPQETPKQRVLALLNDMLAAGY